MKDIQMNSSYFTIRQIADGVFAAIIKEGMGAWGNAGIIDLGDATLIFDTCLTPQAARELRHMAEQLTTSRITYVVNSHWHFDHVFGNQVFSDTTIISTAKTREMMLSVYDLSDIEKVQVTLKNQLNELNEQREKLTDPGISQSLMNEIIEKTKLIDAIPDVRLTYPSLTFEEKIQLYGTKRSVELISYGGGHSISDAFLYIPEEKIAFMGDLVFVNTHPSIHKQPPEVWVSILERVQTMDIDKIVPGHGEVGHREDIKKTIRYLNQILEIVKNGMEKKYFLEQVRDIPMPKEYGNWAFSHVFRWNLEAVFKLHC